jgi:hypothetical protein
MRPLFIAAIVLGFLFVSSSDITATSVTAVVKKSSNPAPYSVGQKVFVSGVENGELVVPNPNLWKQPGSLDVQGQGISTSVKSGTPVKIISSTFASGRWFFHIETFGANKAKSGWISESLLKP